MTTAEGVIAYRGRIEVFVNSKGTLTVVNVVPLEEYLLGVVPAELSLPHLEAQKAQAIAARTYAVANINGYGSKGFDMLPTVWSQVYKGVSIETAMGTRAVNETRGQIATYNGKPIMAYFTSTCGGRTENSENVFGGLTVNWVDGEGGTKPSTSAEIGVQRLQPNEWAGVMTVTDKLMRNWTAAADTSGMRSRRYRSRSRSAVW